MDTCIFYYIFLWMNVWEIFGMFIHNLLTFCNRCNSQDRYFKIIKCSLKCSYTMEKCVYISYFLCLKGLRLSIIYKLALRIMPETFRSTARRISSAIEATKELSIRTHRAKSTSLLVTSTAILIGFRSLYDVVSSMDYNVTSFLNTVRETVNILMKPNYMLDESQWFMDVKIREQLKKINVSSTRVFI